MSTIGHSHRPIGEPNWSNNPGAQEVQSSAASGAAEAISAQATPPSEAPVPSKAEALANTEDHTRSYESYNLETTVSFGKNGIETQRAEIQPITKLSQSQTDPRSEAEVLLSAALKEPSESVNAYRQHHSSVSEAELNQALDSLKGLIFQNLPTIQPPR